MATVILVVCVSLSAALLVGGFALRNRLSTGQTLAATMLTPVTLVSCALSGAYLWDGPAIIIDGAGPVREMLTSFERQFSEWHTEPKPAGSFSVWVLGDSTHQSRGKNEMRMTPAIRDAAFQKGVKDVRIFGVQNPNCNAFEFYFLLNRLVEDPPDLVVLPLNLRAFGPRWIDDSRNGFPVMERYVEWDRIREATHLSARGRQITWVSVVLRKLDWEVFGSQAQWFLNGLKLRFESSIRAPEEVPDLMLPDNPRAAKQRTLEEAEAWLAEYRKIIEATYDPRVDEHHPLIPVLKTIARRASERGVGVMYYTVQTPDLRAQQLPNFTALRRALSGEPNVRFIEMLNEIPLEEFERLEHFTTPGMRRVAARLLTEIMAARDDTAWRESVRAQAQ